MIVEENYHVVVVEVLKTAYIFQAQTKADLGTVWIGNTGEWNVSFENGVTYLPINACLDLLGYGKDKSNAKNHT